MSYCVRRTFISIILLYLGAQAQSANSTKRSAALGKLPLSKFYETANPLPLRNPGELIRSAEPDTYDLPEDVNTVRFLYHSRSSSGDDVAVSGVVLFPAVKPPAGGWPIIAWAHGWTGVARDCAPSLAKDLQHGPFLAMYVHLGYAVVASDYTGLGTSFRSAFVDLPSTAVDVIYSIPAARAAVLQLGSRWIAMGMAEGGITAVGLAELESDIRDPDYLGSVAISRLADLQDLYGPANPANNKLPLFLAYGIKTVYPRFETRDMLRDAAIPSYQEVSGHCGQELGHGPSVEEMLKPNWRRNEFVQDYFNRSRLGLKRAREPLLVITSQSDPAIAQTTKIVARLCKLGDQVEFQKYPESDPGRVIGDSARDQIAWIQSRFANRPAHSNCSAH